MKGGLRGNVCPIIDCSVCTIRAPNTRHDTTLKILYMWVTRGISTLKNVIL